jgi:hypothetical protein
MDGDDGYGGVMKRKGSDSSIDSYSDDSFEKDEEDDKF